MCYTSFYYQKDGPGILKRTYLDRIYGSKYAHLEYESLKSTSAHLYKLQATYRSSFNYAKEQTGIPPF